MGVIRTDKWLDEHFYKPIDLLKKTSSFRTDEVSGFYDYLKFFGMYQPSGHSKVVYEELKTVKAWEIIENLYLKYKKIFNGPEVNIYIFPINVTNRQLMRQTNGKSGVTIEKDLYLFLSPLADKKEWEALFIHEYHHAARIQKLRKKPFDFTLLDSMVLEGLAEHAVEEYCGEKYVAKMSKGHSDKLLKRFWNSDFKGRLNVLKKERIHDDLLFGKRLVPHMMGYALGYKIIEEYKKNYPFSTQEKIDIPSKDLLIRNFLE
ncbi:DUF2268 domain-containing protein [Heyndrickxia acidicola]|uniref:DUF2268 domain-containing putative Zn-dependent protease n=1 Tax=Heyndrickxia acidicola TaxID=209389 RepID=A0ABU6MDM1_9BACI|nr:DUF2268 domain-containing putative Zn-dependent protease [Heyndrickxia acidicola]MED1202507.1 DUF2268 domain-containing putative Zn-dependent protease [Heyndrickxia acidicola]